MLAGNPYLSIISATITPAILILASGSLVASTLTRLSRVVDRARMLIDRIGTLREEGEGSALLALSTELLLTYQRRAGFAERALQFYYIAIGLFVASSLAIAVDNVMLVHLPWVSLLLVVAGAVMLFAGTAALVLETNIATGMLRREIEAMCGPIPRTSSRRARTAIPTAASPAD